MIRINLLQESEVNYMARFERKIGASPSREALSYAEELRTKKQNAIENFGPELGSAYFDYAHGYTEQARSNFAHAVVSALETGNQEEKVKSVEALLLAVEERIRPVARAAGRANAHLLRY